MKMKANFVAMIAVTLFAVQSPASAQDLTEEAEFAALVQSVEAGCAAAPDDCVTLITAALGQLRGFGLAPAALNARIAEIVTQVANVAPTLPVAQRAAIADAVRVAADPDLGFVGAAEEIAAQLAALDDLASAIEDGADIDPVITAQFASAA